MELKCIELMSLMLPIHRFYSVVFLELYVRLTRDDSVA